MPSLTQMAADQIHDMQQLQPHGPYFIIGECQGGILAYETARQLRAKGETVGLLMLFDTPAWSPGAYFQRRLTGRLHYRKRFGAKTFWPPKPWIWQYLQTRGAFHLTRMRQLGLTDRVRYGTEKLGAALSILYERPGAVSSRSQQPSTTTNGSAPDLTERLKRGEREYFLAVMRHWLRPYDGRVTLLVNEQPHANQSLGWDRYAGGGVEIHKLPGDHDTCIPHNIPLVAKILQQCLALTG
jgi:thioesterase domain-containing protein